MRMELRFATLNDAEKLCLFARQAFYDSYAWYNTEEDMVVYLDSSFSIDKIKTEINDPKATFVLAFDEHHVCGYIKLIWNERPDIPNIDEKQLEIARLYADKKLIGKGIGRLLMEAAIAFAKQVNAAIIWLDVWKENKRAIAFYTKWGFKIVSDWTFMLGKDLQEDYIMVKRLE